MLKFVKEIRRVSGRDHPLAPGSIAVCFTENENGKIFSELIDEILQTTNIEETQTKLDILSLKYWINVEISSAPTIEDVQDLNLGFSKLDKASVEYRLKMTEDENLKVKESARRISANIHIKGLYDASDYSLNFDTCVLDVSESSAEDLEKGMVFIASIAQRPNPSTYIIPTSVANKLLEKEFKETALGKLLESKIKIKSVFALKDDLRNIFVREV